MINPDALRSKFLKSKKQIGFCVETGKYFLSAHEIRTHLFSQFIKKSPTSVLFEDNKIGTGYRVGIKFPKLATICPYRNCPDVSEITVSFSPDKVILELSSFRALLDAMSTMAITHESVYLVIHQILTDGLKVPVTISVNASPFIGMDVIIT